MLMKAIIFAVLAVVVLADEFTLPMFQVQKIKDEIREQCKKTGAEDKATDVENSGKAFIDCLKGLIDPQAIQREIEEARPNGALDEVFKKYCAKAPQLKTCIRSFLDGVSPCVDATSREHIGDINNATGQLIDFVCHKDGDRIALFIAEGGPECFRSKIDDIKSCTETVRDSIKTVDQAKGLTIAERCTKYDELVTCVVGKLETCDSPTPANMIESLAKFIRNSSPCPAKS